jgi:transcriptional regulator with XRE-family HTH domain
MNILRQRLKTIGMTQGQLAAICGIDDPHMSRILNHKMKSYRLSKAIETATGGVIHWLEVFENPSEDSHSPSSLDLSA